MIQIAGQQPVTPLPAGHANSNQRAAEGGGDFLATLQAMVNAVAPQPAATPAPPLPAEAALNPGEADPGEPSQIPVGIGHGDDPSFWNPELTLGAPPTGAAALVVGAPALPEPAPDAPGDQPAAGDLAATLLSDPPAVAGAPATPAGSGASAPNAAVLSNALVPMPLAVVADGGTSDGLTPAAGTPDPADTKKLDTTAPGQQDGTLNPVALQQALAAAASATPAATPLPDPAAGVRATRQLSNRALAIAAAPTLLADTPAVTAGTVTPRDAASEPGVLTDPVDTAGDDVSAAPSQSQPSPATSLPAGVLRLVASSTNDAGTHDGAASDSAHHDELAADSLRAEGRDAAAAVVVAQPGASHEPVVVAPTVIAPPPAAVSVPISVDAPPPQPHQMPAPPPVIVPRSHVTLELDPAQTGASRLRVAVQGAQVRATITATDGTATVFDRQLPELQRSLQDRGFADVQLAVRTSTQAHAFGTIAAGASPSSDDARSSSPGRQPFAGDQRQAPQQRSGSGDPRDRTDDPPLRQEPEEDVA